MIQNAVDLDNLRAATDGDKELEQELFEEFIHQAEILLQELEAFSGTETDNESWRKTAHAFKGIALNLGAEPLGVLCKIGQEECEAPPERKQEILRGIKSEYAKVHEFLQHEMNI
ncbi:MAG: Hpt domain-containing protein [Alphaproteobacteria bacterium]|nr:Hpt domain-containing protein [Alphaproteobacteria bacterium]